MSENLPPAVEKFIADMRILFSAEADETARWSKVRELHAELLADPEVIEHAATWPDTLQPDGGPGNLLFYKDPDYGFVINALVKAPGAKTYVHDHGISWTSYGVIEGGEAVLRFERKDGGAPGEVPDRAEVEASGEIEVRPGYIDLVAPWEIHAEYNGPERTVAVIVRSHQSGTFDQNRFDAETGAVTRYNGPVQIPYGLG